MSATTSAYDEVAFPSYPFVASHPDRLAVNAHLAGLDICDVTACRVLELGCGAGGNILPLADNLPNSEFIGVDFSAQQIEVAASIRDAIGLTNLKLLERDILKLDDSLGKFDYIICHGVFSWTTEEVREMILSICNSQLKDHGIAYINYSTYPGLHVQHWVRDMIRSRASTFDDPVHQIREARATIDILLDTLDPRRQPYASLLRGELENAKRYDDKFLFHAMLNFKNEGLYLKDFVARCQKHSLRYIGDADPAVGWIGTVPQKSAQRLGQVCSDRIELEQQVDFINNTSSRRSLVTRQSISESMAPNADRLESVYVSGDIVPVANSSLPNASVFQSRSGPKITTTNESLRAILQMIANAWPASVPLTEISSTVDAPRTSWETDFLNCRFAGIIDFTLRPSNCLNENTDRPQTTRLARWQASNESFVTSLRHRAEQLPPLDCQILEHLDGSHDIASLAQKLDVAPKKVEELVRALARKSLLLKEQSPR